MSFGVSGTRCSVEEVGWVQRKPGWSRDPDLYPAVVQWERSTLADGGEISPASEEYGALTCVPSQSRCDGGWAMSRAVKRVIVLSE